MRRIATLGLAALVLAAGMFVQRSLAVLAEARQVWRGYYTLLIRDDAAAAPGRAAEEAAQRLRAAGFDAVVTAATARERVTTFGGYEWVAIADLPARLDPLDPRYDPYLRRVAGWFAAETRAGAAQVIYVASALPPGYFAARVGWALRHAGVRWRSADLPWPQTGMALLLFAAGAALMVGRLDPCAPRWWRLLLALPWVPLIVHGALPAAFAALPAFAAACWWAGPVMGAAPRAAGRRRGGRHAAAALLVQLGSVVALGLAAPDQPPGSGSPLALLPAADLRRVAIYLLAGGAWSVALIGAGLLGRLLPAPAAVARWRGGEASVRSVSAAQPQGTAPAGAGGGSAVAAAGRGARLRGGLVPSLALCLLGIAMVLPAGRGELIPRPLPVAAGAGFRLAELSALDTGGGRALPALSHYAAHAAYQETLQYGRPFALPAPDERVTVDHYRRGGDGRVQHAAVEVARFSDDWLQALLAAAPPASVPALLAAQGRPVAVQYAPPPTPAPPAAAAWLALTLLLAGAMLPLRRRQRGEPTQHKAEAG